MVNRFLRFLVLGALTLAMGVLRAGQSGTPETTIWLDAPARNFTESLPMGNGRLGAMLFGGVDQERIVLNESSVWSGAPQDADRPGAAEALPEIRRLLLEGKNDAAEALVTANFTCQGPGSSGGAYGCYQVLGNLHLAFDYDERLAHSTQYRRELNLCDATARLQFVRGNVRFTRELFVSAPDQVIVLRLTASQPGQISFQLGLDRPERFSTVAVGGHELLMTGQLDNGTDGKGLRYSARVRVRTEGGGCRADGNKLRVNHADEVLILISAATDYRGFAGRQISDPLAATQNDLDGVADLNHRSLHRAHSADYQRFFGRNHLRLQSIDTGTVLKPTPRRVQAFRQGAPDPSLAALYYNFGRYLLISSSRPGGFPANLQGIWAEEIRTPWTGDWHLDVNVQMNYWPAEVCNLSELHQPLFALIASLQNPGAKTARAYYDARGWVAHVITNPWGFTSPGEGASWGASNSGSAWLCQHLYDHFLFTGDKEFLRWAYPILKGSARFYADMLIEEPKHGWLVVAPANSPENHFRLPNGKQAAICLGPTMHSQLVRYLFDACIDSARILDLDAEFRQELADKRSRLAPTRIGSDGRIMEWLEEYSEPEPKHRHVSHLWGLYPGNEISPNTTPELAEAARKSLEVRGDDGVGWSLAYKIALWARLQDGNRAWALLSKALNPVTDLNIRYDGGGGVYPNLFDASPPFQIDGNFGATAAIGEMLLQSHDEIIHLLPALPEAWRTGEFRGVRARGGIQVDLYWKDARLTRATICADHDVTSRVKYRDKTIMLNLKAGKPVHLSSGQFKSS